MANSLFQSFEENKEKDTPYKGEITFTDKAISFFDNTLLLKNVAQFSKYGIIRLYRIPDLMMIIAGIIALASFFFLPYGLITLIPAAFVLFIAISERRRPKLYGLTIELNSGSKHYFQSVDLNGINSLFATITLAISLPGDFTIQAKYEDKRVIITNSTVGVVGDNNKNNTINQK